MYAIYSDDLYFFFFANILTIPQVIPANLPLAVEWFRKAADAGNIDGYFNLAACLEDGKVEYA